METACEPLPGPIWSAGSPQRAYADRATRLARVERLLGRVESIFNRGDCDWGSRDLGSTFLPLAKAYVLGDLAVRLVRIPLRHCVAARTSRRFAHGNESMDHTLLKRAALLWMHDLGATDAEEERWATGGKADVFSEARQWVVECGNTPIRKLIDAVRAADGTRFTLVPYQRPVGDAARATGLIALDFVWSPALSDEMRALETAARHAALARAAEILSRPGIDPFAPLPLAQEA